MDNRQIYAVKRAINFDLDTKKIEKYHIKPYNKAYSEIKLTMTKLDFIHRQGYGYISNKLLENDDVIDIANELANKLPWLSKCLKNIDVTDYCKYT